MSSQPIFLVDMVSEIIDIVKIETGLNINYLFGNNIQILENLQAKDKSVTLQELKYPLFALYMPFKEGYGRGYVDLTIKKIVIATLTDKDTTPAERYLDGGTFKSVLYPVYNSFLKFFVRHKNSVIRGVEELVHYKEDFCPIVPVGSGINDYIDKIEISDLQTKLKQLSNC